MVKKTLEERLEALSSQKELEAARERIKNFDFELNYESELAILRAQSLSQDDLIEILARSNILLRYLIDVETIEVGLVRREEIEHFVELSGAYGDGCKDGLLHGKSLLARAAANALHSKPGGSRDKQAAIKKAWASGKYTSRDICAEQESAALGMSFSAARKALRGTPDPV